MKDEASPIRRVSVQEAQRLIVDGFDIVDVREELEWTGGHVPGARHVPLATILASPRTHGFRDNTIFVCAVGERSAVAAEMAVALGLQGVVNLDGGTNAWRKAGLPLETPDGPV